MKNCPFCQSFNTKVTGEGYSDGTHSVFIKCLNCNAQGPSISGEGKFFSDDEAALALAKWSNQIATEAPKKVYAISHEVNAIIEGEPKKEKFISPYFFPIYLREKDARKEAGVDMNVIELEVK
jgi:hypothetical protein